MSTKKPTFNDIYSVPPNELKRHYKMSDKQFENVVRDHLYGANQQSMRKEYEKIYSKNRRDK